MDAVKGCKKWFPSRAVLIAAAFVAVIAVLATVPIDALSEPTPPKAFAPITSAEGRGESFELILETRGAVAEVITNRSRSIPRDQLYLKSAQSGSSNDNPHNLF